MELLAGVERPSAHIPLYFKIIQLKAGVWTQTSFLERGKVNIHNLSDLFRLMLVFTPFPPSFNLVLHAHQPRKVEHWKMSRETT